MRDKCFSSGNSITRCEPANGNIICTYGKFGLSKLANADRLKVCKSGEETISLERAAEIISEKTACFSPAEIAVTVCENMTDNELEKAAELSKKLGCTLVDMGNIDRDISTADCAKFEKIFGTDFYIGANREKAASLGAVDSTAIDFQKSRLLSRLAARLPRVILISPPCSRQMKHAMFLYRLRCPLNAEVRSAKLKFHPR